MSEASTVSPGVIVDVLTQIGELYGALRSTDASATQLVRDVVRIARLCSDHAYVYRFQLELVDHNDKKARRQLDSELQQRVGAQQATQIRSWAVEDYISERTKPGAENADDDARVLLSHSLPEAERYIRLYATDEERMMDAYPTLIDNRDANRAIGGLIEAAMLFQVVVERVKERVHQYISIVEAQLRLSQDALDVFGRYERDVHRLLGVLAPVALEELVSARKRAKEGQSPERAQALLACRRVLLAVADVVCPAQIEQITGADGKSKKLSRDDVVNRIAYFLQQHLDSDSTTAMLLASLDDLGNRLDKVLKKAMKGVHWDATQYETDACLVQTYLLVGDVLYLHDRVMNGPDAALIGESAES